MGRDKDSLTEREQQQHRKGELYKTNPQNRTALSDRTAAVPSGAASELSPRRPPHRNPARRHMVWNTRLCLARLGLGQPTRLCPFLDSGEN